MYKKMFLKGILFTLTVAIVGIYFTSCSSDTPKIERSDVDIDEVVSDVELIEIADEAEIEETQLAADCVNIPPVNPDECVSKTPQSYILTRNYPSNLYYVYSDDMNFAERIFFYYALGEIREGDQTTERKNYYIALDANTGTFNVTESKEFIFWQSYFWDNVCWLGGEELKKVDLTDEGIKLSDESSVVPPSVHAQAQYGEFLIGWDEDMKNMMVYSLKDKAVKAVKTIPYRLCSIYVFDKLLAFTCQGVSDSDPEFLMYYFDATALPEWKPIEVEGDAKDHEGFFVNGFHNGILYGAGGIGHNKILRIQFDFENGKAAYLKSLIFSDRVLDAYFRAGRMFVQTNEGMYVYDLSTEPPTKAATLDIREDVIGFFNGNIVTGYFRDSRSYQSPYGDYDGEYDYSVEIKFYDISGCLPPNPSAYKCCDKAEGKLCSIENKHYGVCSNQQCK